MPTKVIVNKKIDLSLGTSSRVLSPGEHLLSDEEMSLWFIPGLIAEGAITFPKSGDPAKQKTLEYKETPRIVQTAEGPKVEETAVEGEAKGTENTESSAEEDENKEEEKEAKPKSGKVRIRSTK